jgi:hypothetical protein
MKPTENRQLVKIVQDGGLCRNGKLYKPPFKKGEVVDVPPAVANDLVKTQHAEKVKSK